MLNNVTVENADITALKYDDNVFDKAVAADLFNKAGAGFKRHFNEDTYKEFFKRMGIEDVKFHVCEGRMACDVAEFINT